MKRTLIYAIAACMLAAPIIITPPKAHAGVEVFLTTDDAYPTSSGVGSPNPDPWYYTLYMKIFG